MLPIKIIQGSCILYMHKMDIFTESIDTLIDLSPEKSQTKVAETARLAITILRGRLLPLHSNDQVPDSAIQLDPG